MSRVVKRRLIGCSLHYEAAHRSRAAAFALLCALLLAACGSGGTDKSPKARRQVQSPGTERLGGGKHGGRLTAIDPTGIRGVDPGRAQSPAEFEIAYATQRPLFSYRPNTFAESSPDLASEPAVISPDAMTVTVHIRRDVHFGPPVNREVNSADVAYAIERAANPNVATPYWATYFSSLEGFQRARGGPIRGIATPDRHTIVFHLTEPRGQRVRDALALPVSAPVPKELAEKYDARRPSVYGDYQVATGPYMLRSTHGKVLGIGYKPRKMASLVRNPNWNANTDYRPAYLDEIDVRIGGDPATRGRQVLDGAGLVGGLPTARSIAQLAYRRFPAQLQISPGAGLRYIALNIRHGPFSRLEVRKALWAAVDRGALNGPADGPPLEQVATHFLTPEIPGFSLARAYLDNRGAELDYDQHPHGDLHIAERYMRLAGHPTGQYGGTDRVRVVGSEREPEASRAKSIDKTLKALGFATKLRLVSRSAMSAEYCRAPMARVDVCPDMERTAAFGDGELILGAPLNGNVSHLPRASRPSLPHQPGLTAAIERESALVGVAPRAHGWGAVDNALVGEAIAIPYTWLSEAAIESNDVAGVGDLWNRGAWDYSFTSLK